MSEQKTRAQRQLRNQAKRHYPTWNKFHAIYLKIQILTWASLRRQICQRLGIQERKSCGWPGRIATSRC